MDYARFSLLQKLAREFGHARIRDAGFSDTGHAVCTFLRFHDGVSQDAVSNALMLDKTTVAKALRALEQEGLVHRAPNERNRRENVLRLTDAGRERVAGSLRIYESWWEEVGSCLSAEESSRLDELLGRMARKALSLRDDAAKKT